MKLLKAPWNKGRQQFITFNLSDEAREGLKQIAIELGFTNPRSNGGISGLLNAIGLGYVTIHIPTQEEVEAHKLLIANMPPRGPLKDNPL